jgi:hypothetical protein
MGIVITAAVIADGKAAIAVAVVVTGADGKGGGEDDKVAKAGHQHLRLSRFPR